MMVRLLRRALGHVGLGLGLLLGATGAAAAAPPLEYYGRLPGFEDAALSPSGKHMAILATVKGKRMVVVLEIGGDSLVTFGFAETDKIRSIRWAGDQAVLVDYSVTSALPLGFTTDKAELFSVLVMPLDKSPSWTVFGKFPQVTGGVMGNFGVLERNGRWYGYFGGVTLEPSTTGGAGTLPNGRLRPDLYEVDLQSQKTRRLAARAGGEMSDRDWLVDTTGAVGASLDWFRDTGQWTLYDARKQKLVSGKTAGGASLLGFTADGTGVIYSVREVIGENGRWFSVPLTGGTPQPFLEEEAVERLLYGPGQRLIGYIDGHAGGAAHYFDPQRDKTYKATQRAFRGKRISIESASASFDQLLVKVDGLDDPGTWYRVDVPQKRADMVGMAYPFKSDEVGSSRMFAYTAADGTKMEGVLTLPPGRSAKALPAIIMPHGGPTAHDEVGFDWWAQAYASRGYAVFQPNFRGSTGYGDAFEQAGKGEWGRKMQTDLSDGLAELARQGLVDPKRVAIVGGSYGGYAALAGVTLQQDLYRCAVSVAGVGDLAGFVTNRINDTQDPVITKSLRAEIGKGRDLKAVSPIRFVDKVSVPVMLIHGKDDTVVDYSQSSAMAAALRRAGKSVEFVTLAGEDHWLSKSATRLAMLQASVDFVIKHNPPDPDPAAPAPAAARP